MAAELGIEVDEHGKMPDVVVFDRERGWLVLIEAVTSHSPVNAKRIGELRELFSGVTSGLVWGHLVHFDGERFLGPYDEPPL